MKRVLLLIVISLSSACFCDSSPPAEPDAAPLTCNDLAVQCGLWGTPGNRLDCGTCLVTQYCSIDGFCVATP